MIYKSLRLTQYLIISVIITTLLSSCGFKLRGWKQVKLNINELYLDYTNVSHTGLNSRFINGLVSNLRSSNIKVVPYGFNNPEQTKPNDKNLNDYTLELVSAEYTKKINSTGSSQLVTQYKLSFNAIFKIYHKNKLILTNQMINAQRNYNYTQNQILGLDYEEETITNELIQEVTDRIINQLVIATA